MEVHTKKTTRILGILPPPPRPKYIKPSLPTYHGRQRPFTIKTSKGNVVVLENYKYSELVDMIYICNDPMYKESSYTKNYRMILQELGTGVTPEDIEDLMKSDPNQRVYHVKFPDKMEWLSEDDPLLVSIKKATPLQFTYAESVNTDYVPHLPMANGRHVGGKSKKSKSKSKKSKKYK